MNTTTPITPVAPKPIHRTRIKHYELVQTGSDSRRNVISVTVKTKQQLH